MLDVFKTKCPHNRVLSRFKHCDECLASARMCALRKAGPRMPTANRSLPVSALLLESRYVTPDDVNGGRLEIFGAEDALLASYDIESDLFVYGSQLGIRATRGFVMPCKSSGTAARARIRRRDGCEVWSGDIGSLIQGTRALHFGVTITFESFSLLWMTHLPELPKGAA